MIYDAARSGGYVQNFKSIRKKIKKNYFERSFFLWGGGDWTAVNIKS